MYEYFQKLLDERGITAAEVSRATGISQAALSIWKKRNGKMNIEFLSRIAEFFDVPVEYFTDGLSDTERGLHRLACEKQEDLESYYQDKETAKIMKQIFESPGRRALFNAVADMDEATVQKYAKFIEDITGDNNKSN